MHQAQIDLASLSLVHMVEAGSQKKRKKEKNKYDHYHTPEQKEAFSTSLALKHHQFTRLKRSENSHLSISVCNTQ